MLIPIERLGALWLLCLATACVGSGAHVRSESRPLEFIADDYPAALALARERRRPLFVNVSAPWCHSCRFMKSHVFNQPRLGQQAHRFVFLELDSEKAQSAAFLERHPVEVLPSFLIIEPVSQRMVFLWSGNATASQLEQLFDEAEAALGRSVAAENAVERADRLNAQSRWAEAAEGYRSALEGAPSEWEKRPRVTESLLMALMLDGDLNGCSATAVRLLPPLERGQSFANGAALGLSCALSAAPDAPWRAERLTSLESLGMEALEDTAVLADDRSSLFGLLVDARQAASDIEGSKRWSRRWLEFIEEQSARAPTAGARAAFDSHRVQAAIKLGEPQLAVEALKQSEAALPGDYNPPARLAVVYRQMGQLDWALAANQRALDKAYGPRRVRLWETRAELQLQLGDQAAARDSLNQALDAHVALPPAQQSAQTRERLRAALRGLEKQSSP